MSFILEESYTPGNTNLGSTIPFVGGPFNFTRRTMIFTASKSYTLAKIALRLRASAYPKDCTVALYNVAGGEPSGLLTSETMTLTAIESWPSIELSSPVSLNSGTQYAIVSDAPVSGTTSSYYHSGANEGTSYPNGYSLIWDDNGSNWILIDLLDDHPFRLYSELSTPEKATNPTPTDIGTGIVLLPTLSWEAG